MSIIVVHGPPACGKTRNAQKLLKTLGCRTLVDGWYPGDCTLTRAAVAQAPKPVLLLTTASPTEIRAALPSARIVRFQDAMR